MQIYKRSPQPEEGVQDDKDLFSAMIKYLCWGIQVKLLFVFWFNEWFEQWQCWEAQMLGLLKPALMPIQGSVWSCVRLQQDQSTVMTLWGSQHRGVGGKVLPQPQRFTLGRGCGRRSEKVAEIITVFICCLCWKNPLAGKVFSLFGPRWIKYSLIKMQADTARFSDTKELTQYLGIFLSRASMLPITPLERSHSTTRLC